MRVEPGVCSFCGIPNAVVRSTVTTADSSICEPCASLCAEAIESMPPEQFAAVEEAAARLPAPEKMS